MNKYFPTLIILLILTSCSITKEIFDQNGTIEKLGTPIKVEYYQVAKDNSNTETFAIIDPLELKKVMDELKNADNPEPWKGARWNKIKVYYSDTILNINTNNEKIGLSSSGIFYSLDKDNFISKRLKKK